MIISTSGFYSTGSSAVFALLEEYGSCTSGKLENWQIRGIDYENILLYTPDGVFDLEDKLLIGNSIHRSDEALRRFQEKMLLLYNNNFFSMGGFKALLGKEFYSTLEHYDTNRKFFGSEEDSAEAGLTQLADGIANERWQLWYVMVPYDKYYCNVKNSIKFLNNELNKAKYKCSYYMNISCNPKRKYMFYTVFVR